MNKYVTDIDPYFEKMNKMKETQKYSVLWHGVILCGLTTRNMKIEFSLDFKNSLHKKAYQV